MKTPYVNIKVTKEGVTAEQKRRLIDGTTELLQEILNKDPHTTCVVIDEIDTDNWGVADEMAGERSSGGRRRYFLWQIKRAFGPVQ